MGFRQDFAKTGYSMCVHLPAGLFVQRTLRAARRKEPLLFTALLRGNPHPLGALGAFVTGKRKTSRHPARGSDEKVLKKIDRGSSRVGSGQEMFEISRHRSGRVGPGRVVLTRCDGDACCD